MTIRVLDNDWTVVTADGKLSAHYENTVLITDGEPEILTMAEDHMTLSEEVITWRKTM